jgi:molybdopterin-guanine dinucleotide biosynthesis protein A
MRSAVILAGGRSTRFGDADKAVADLAGVPMSRRVADRLASVVDELVVNCRPDQRAALETAMEGYEHPVVFAVDDSPDRGPMAGIYEGLRAASGEYAIVVACDMPFVDPAVVSYLFDRADGTADPPADADDEGEPPYDAAVPRLGDGWFQTTQAVFRPEPMADACEEALREGKRKILDPLFSLSYAVVSEAELEALAGGAALSTFDNVNTREEFEAAERRLSGEETSSKR